MTTDNRDKMTKPDFLNDEAWEGLKDATGSLARIRGDAKADVQRYLDNPDGWSTGKGSPSGLPTLLLTVLGRKSGEQRTTPLVFLQDGEQMVVVGSLVACTPEEREALWPKLDMVFPAWGFFQKQTDRPFPIVILTPTGQA